MIFDSIFVYEVQSRLLIKKFIGCFIELENVIAEVFRGRKFEKVSIEGRHLGLNVIEEESLNEVATVYSDRNFLEEFGDGEVLRSNFLLQETQLICCRDGLA